MSYSNFTALVLKERFGVEQVYRSNLLAQVAPRAASELVKQTLAANLSFALMQGSEKARSEFIIAPIFAELRKQTEERVSIFSGIEFDIDYERGLNGVCDFLVSRSPYQAALEAPVMVAVEAKRQDFERGLAQCIAEMIAAQIYNERRAQNVTTIYGCVTTGDVWRFLVLRGKLAEIEASPFSLPSDLEKILGILWAMTFDEVSHAGL